MSRARARSRAPRPRRTSWRCRRPRASAEPIPAAGKGETLFLRKGLGLGSSFGADEGAYGPNFTNVKEDLDVPTFLHREMD